MKAMYQYVAEVRNPFSLRSMKERIREQKRVAEDVFADQRPKDVTFISKYDTAEETKTLLDNVYVPFISPFVNERAKLQGGCFIRFPLLDGQTDKDFTDHRLEVFVKSDNRFSDCLAKFVFIHPSSIHKELSMLNLRISRIYPEVENIALGIKRRLFESESPS